MKEKQEPTIIVQRLYTLSWRLAWGNMMRRMAPGQLCILCVTSHYPTSDFLSHHVNAHKVSLRLDTS